MPPSAIFYNDSLEPCAKNGVVSWSGLPNPRLPVIFFGCDSEEASTDEVCLSSLTSCLQLITSDFSERLGLMMARSSV
jgi:hypothetical protein